MHKKGDSSGMAACARLLPVLFLVLFGSAPAFAQGGACDCSCDAYRSMMDVMAEARAAADAGDYSNMPPEALEMSGCAGSCAMQWARCENPDADFDAMQAPPDYPDIARPTPHPGSVARERGSDAVPESDGLPKDRLTPDYLEGRWCSVYGGQETTQWLFDSEGGYRIGVPAGTGYAMQPEVNSLRHFRERFEQLIEFEPDTFTTRHRHGRENVFTRGACNK